MKTGLINMGLGLLIAAIGALVTGLTYSMVSGSGGTYVVAYGAFVVGAWRFVLGLYQVVRGALGGSSVERAVSPTGRYPRADAAARTAPQDASSAAHIVGGVLIAGAVLRFIFLGLFLYRVPSSLLYNGTLLLTAVGLPAAVAVGGVVAGAMLFRDRPSAVPFALGFCIVGLLFEAYALVGLSISRYHVWWFSWFLLGVHTTAYAVSLIVLGRRATNLTRVTG